MKSFLAHRLIAISKPVKVSSVDGTSGEQFDVETSSGRPMPEGQRHPSFLNGFESADRPASFTVSSAEPILGEASRLSAQRYTRVPTPQDPIQHPTRKFSEALDATADVFTVSSAEPILGEASRLSDLLEYNRNFPIMNKSGERITTDMLPPDLRFSLPDENPQLRDIKTIFPSNPGSEHPVSLSTTD